MPICFRALPRSNYLEPDRLKFLESRGCEVGCMAKKTISFGSKVAHRYARTDPPGLFGKSMLAEVQALPRVLDPSRLFWWEYVFR